MEKKIAVVIGISVFVIVLFTYVFLGRKLGLVPPPPTPPGMEDAIVEANASMTVSSATLEAEDQGSSLNIDISLSAEKVNVSAASLRLVHEYSGDNPLVSYEDADATQEGIQIKVNQELVEAGWTFPVNTVYADKENKKVFIDVALANLKPEGYYLDDAINIGSLEVTQDDLGGNLIFKFDTQESHLFRKDGKEIRLQLQDITYDVD